MLVTFGREATQELRERVRERLVSAERGLRDPAAARAGGRRGAARCSPARRDAEVALRRRAAGRTRSPTFDAATIATTHQFCQQMLAGARHRRRRRPGRGVRRVRRRPGRRGRRRPLRAQVRRDRRRHRRVRPREPRCELARARRRRRAGPVGARRRRAGRPRPARHAFATAVRGRGRAAQAGAARLHATTTCSPGCDDALADPVTRSARRGCGPATGSCWSTSSRTPTRCSGSILRRAFHGHAHAGADRRPEAGDLRVPRRRRRHATSRPPSTADAHATLAAQLAQRRRPARRAGHGVRRGGAGRRADRRARGGGRARRSPRLAGAPVDAAGARAGRSPATGLRAAADAGSSLPPEARTGSSRDVAADVAALLASAATVDGAALQRRRRRGAGAHQRAGPAGAGRARGRGRARGGHGHRERVRHPGRGRDWLTLLEALEQPRLARICGPPR